MKELSIEEKAKAYDEAKRRGLDYIRLTPATELVTRQSILEHIFPELKESEDERIKKAIKKALQVRCDGSRIISDEPVTLEEAISWLEKQGEQNPTLPKWKYKKDNTPLLRDSLILNKYGCVAKSPSGALVSDVWVIDYDELAKLPKKEFEKQGEQKPATWSEEDEKIYKKVKTAINSYYAPFSRDAEEMSEWFKNLKYRCLPQQKQEWSDEDKIMKGKTINYINAARMYVDVERVPSQWADECINWLKFLKDRIQPQSKWSEEDEEIVKALNEYVKNLDIFFSEIKIGNKDILSKEFREKVQLWLKSLRPQNRWKPSDEQIKVCKEVYADILSAKGFDLGTVNSELNRLEEELKKLKAL